MENNITSSNNHETDFDKILTQIETSKKIAYRHINEEQMLLYYNIGKFVSIKINNNDWGKKIVQNLSDYLKSKRPTLKGFDSRNIWRMMKFYETYKYNEILPTLWSQLNWSNNRRIMQLKTEEERMFYLKICGDNNYSVRDLERLISSSTFERTILADQKISETVKSLPQSTVGIFKDVYMLDYLDLPIPHKEKDISNAIMSSLKDFILELGSGFTFIGQEYRVQVGSDDFYIDLLFFHRHLKCLVAIELKNDKFRPADLGQLEFYLEALDRDIRVEGENPSIGILLCREKNDEVVKYALSRSMSPSVIAEYETKLIPKEVLQKKLNEFYLLLKN